MTAPLAGAVSGASYSGTMGSTTGDLARGAAAFVKGMKDEQERRQARAMEQALLELRKQAQASGDANAAAELDIRRQQLEQARINAENDATIARERMGVDRENAAATRELTAAQRAETERHNRASEDISRQNATARETRSERGWAPIVVQGPGGEIMVVDKNSRTVSPTSPAAGAQIPTSAAGSPVGSGARPAQGEREAKASYDTLNEGFKQLEGQMTAVGHQAPDVGTQVAVDASKSTGTGIISSLKRGVANTYLGKKQPEYQQIEQSIKGLGLHVVKMLTGAQMSEPEAQRIFTTFAPVAGDSQQLVRQKLESIRNVIRAQYAKVGRAAELDGNAGVPGAAAPAAGASSLKQKYGLEE